MANDQTNEQSSLPQDLHDRLFELLEDYDGKAGIVVLVMPADKAKQVNDRFAAVNVTAVSNVDPEIAIQLMIASASECAVSHDLDPALYHSAVEQHKPDQKRH